MRKEDSLPEKRCTKCGESQDSSSFYPAKHHKDGLASSCKKCRAREAHGYYTKNKAKILGRNKLWAAEHTDYYREKAKTYSKEHPEKVREAERKRYKKNPGTKIASAKKWYFSHPESVRAARRKRDARRRATPTGKLNMRMSAAVNDALGRGSGIKGRRHWESLVGYTVAQLKAHLEKQFKQGMFWNNRGIIWEIDHKIPISAFNFETPEDVDFRNCWALRNLQPLAKMENKKKSNAIDRPFQPSLLISGKEKV